MLDERRWPNFSCLFQDFQISEKMEAWLQHQWLKQELVNLIAKEVELNLLIILIMDFRSAHQI
jgi:hypothetical protein